tara:strand:+ start:579 stop:797 length:219 start_codon:yes stop_codon:yes gene_type:complete
MRVESKKSAIDGRQPVRMQDPRRQRLRISFKRWRHVFSESVQHGVRIAKITNIVFIFFAVLLNAIFIGHGIS